MYIYCDNAKIMLINDTLELAHNA